MSALRSDELSGTRILVVEDDADILRMVANVLEGAGAIVTRAGSGRASLETLRHATFDALVVDWNLGDMSGATLLPELVAAYPELATKILVVTGELMSAVQEHDAAVAGYTVLNKPFRPAELRAAILDITR